MTDENRDISLTDFYLARIDKLYNDPLVKKRFLNCPSTLTIDSSPNEREVFEKVLTLCLEEAESMLSLIQNFNFTKNDLLLEIGGGFGFIYGFLKKQGFNVYGIEPSDSGFDDYFHIANRIFKIIDVDGCNFYPLSAQECVKLNKQFDIIFSNNVLEHIPELEQALSAMKHSLKPNGAMVHNTVNYYIPFEPHFKMMILPFFPKLTEFFKPSLKKSSVWQSLNFITTGKLKKICKANHLKIEFKKDKLQKTLLRLENDPMFAERHKYFIPLYRILKLTRLIKIIDKIPIALTTPITITIRKWPTAPQAGLNVLPR